MLAELAVTCSAHKAAELFLTGPVQHLAEYLQVMKWSYTQRRVHTGEGDFWLCSTSSEEAA